jgi:hypothetical protein
VRCPTRFVATIVALLAACEYESPADPTDAEQDECEHMVHRDGDVAVSGCRDRISAIQLGNVVQTAPGPTLLEPGKRLHDCTWTTFTDTAKVMLATCPADTHVVSGGCMSQTRMLASAPWETYVGDLPEHGERYQDVADTNGWMCIYDGPYPSGQIATALCCE